MHDESGIAWDVETRDDGTRSLRVAAQPGRRYTIEQSADLEEWSPVRSWLGLTTGQVVSTDIFVGPPPPGAPTGQGQPVSPPADLPRTAMVMLQPVDDDSTVLVWQTGSSCVRIHEPLASGSWGPPTMIILHAMEFEGWTVLLQSIDLAWSAASPSLPPADPVLSQDDSDFHAALLSNRAAIASAVQAIHDKQQAALQEARLHGLAAGASAQGRYFRVREDGGIDSDGDGLTDEQELASGLNIFCGDTDGDGMDDRFEVANGLDARSDADASADADGDGDTNLAEYLAGSDPRVPDADHDGLPDPWEQTWASLVLATIDPNDPPAHLDATMLAALQSGNLDPEADYTNDGLTTRQQHTACPDPLADDGDTTTWLVKGKYFDPCSGSVVFDTRWGGSQVLGWGLRWMEFSWPGSWVSSQAPAVENPDLASGLSGLEGLSPSWVNDWFNQQLPMESLGIQVVREGGVGLPYAVASFQETSPQTGYKRFVFKKQQVWLKACRAKPGQDANWCLQTTL